jgi:phosphohistidine phosphatase
MDLILWRHADAEGGSPDSERRLTERGREQARRVAAWLKARLPRGCEVLVSP